MDIAPYGLTFIFTAGLISLFSPCSYPMLPGYIAYYIGGNTSSEKIVKSAIASVLGILTVFSIIGAGISIFGTLIANYIPAIQKIAGLTTIIMGLVILFEVKIPMLLKLKAPNRKGVIGIFLYSALFGLASISCSAPIFFSIIFYAIASGGLFIGFITFIVYALGMGTPLFLITILAAKTKETILNRITKVIPILYKIAGITLVISGVYLIFISF